MGLEQITQQAKRANVYLFGNRVVLVGITFLGYGALTFSSLPAHELNSVTAGLSFCAFCAGAGIVGNARFGCSTIAIYRRSMAHISRYGRLDDRFAKAVINGSENEPLTGYCQQQGLYLAARDTGMLATFREAQKQHSNVSIPFI